MSTTEDLRTAPALEQPHAPYARTAKANVAIACLLLAFAQLLIAGYRMGVGNQSIQIAFLKSAIDPTLFANDPLLSTTKDYPTYFFRLLAPLVAYAGLDWTYLLLHVLTAAAVFAATYALAGACHPSRWAGGIAMLLLLAGHQHALAGDDLYSQGFTHTWAVFPLAIASLAFMYGNRPIAAFALAGLIFNFHALTGAYLFVMCAACLLGDSTFAWKNRWLPFVVFALVAAPTAVHMLPHGQQWDAMWIVRTQIRSGDHVFPSAWWQPGDPEVPRFATIIALAALALSFPGRAGSLRKTLWLAAGGGLLLAAGFVLVQIIPVPEVMRAQLFRSTRLVLLLALVQIACGLAAVLDLRRTTTLSRWCRYAEMGSAIITFCCLAVPALAPWLPVALVIALLVALTNRRLAWWQAMMAALALLTCIIAARTIDFSIPGLATLGNGIAAIVQWPLLAWVCLGLAVFLLGALRTASRIEYRAAIASAVLIAACVARIALAPLAATPTDPWITAQLWAHDNTPKGAVFLTPIRPGGFRIYSDRAVVGEWRDGTQLFFSPEFGDGWWNRMTALQPGMAPDSAGTRMLDPGRSLETLDDTQLIALAHRYNADYVVLPQPHITDATRPINAIILPPEDAHHLIPVFRDAQWAIYQPKLPPSTVPDGANPARWKTQEDFMRDVVAPNIDKYRKGDLKIQLVDSENHPLYDCPFTLKQTGSPFKFSCSLPFFINPPGQYANEDFHPPPVTPVELQRFSQLFNFSMIPFSGKWMYIEPIQGHYYYKDLDAYTEWCHDHDIGMEMHFLSGYWPAWMDTASEDVQKKAYMQHSLDMVNRYRDTVKYWQITNEKILIQDAPDVIRAIRKAAPESQLGISDCARFYSAEKAGPSREYDMLQGLSQIRWLKSQGTPVDYFGFHGHRPFGVWADPHETYDALDAFAKEGVRLHVTEFGTPLNKEEPILGDIRQGPWTAELQADFYERIFTICFSHPSVDMINLWLIGPDSWQPGAGLLDAKFKPKPVFTRLDDLIHNKFMTTLNGRLDLDGVIAARVFNGDYDLALTLPDGSVVHTKLTLATGATGTKRVVLDATTKTLKLQP